MVQETNKYLYDTDEEMARDAIDYVHIQQSVTSQRKPNRITALFKENSKYWKIGVQNNTNITKKNLCAKIHHWRFWCPVTWSKLSIWKQSWASLN